MPVAGRVLPRKRRRPKVDSTALVDTTLVLWLTECSGLNQGELYCAVERIADANYRSERCAAESLKRRLNRELGKLDDEERLQRAIASAEQRGEPVPLRGRERLAVLEERRRVLERALATRITAMLPRAPRLPALPVNFATPLFDFSPMWRPMIPTNVITVCARSRNWRSSTGHFAHRGGIGCCYDRPDACSKPRNGNSTSSSRKTT
jgi:hypothetical protein